MKTESLERRLDALESKPPLIATWVDLALYEGCPLENVRWDPKFKRQLEKLTAELDNE